jgi:hypothetical protein
MKDGNNEIEFNVSITKLCGAFFMIHLSHMADDKGGGGGWEWGALEIVIGLILVIGLLDHLFGDGTLSKQPSPTPAPVVQQTTQNNTCGLTLIRPHANEKVTNVILLAGSAGGCDWKTTKTVALYAQVVDSKGKPVSAYMPVPPSRSSDAGVSFDSAVALTAKPAKGIGYLILVPAVQPPGSHTISTRIPLQF